MHQSCCCRNATSRIVFNWFFECISHKW